MKKINTKINKLDLLFSTIIKLSIGYHTNHTRRFLPYSRENMI